LQLYGFSILFVSIDFLSIEIFDATQKTTSMPSFDLNGLSHNFVA